MSDCTALRLLAAVKFFHDSLGARPVPAWALDCDCLLDPHHRWDCSLTPIWAQTMRDLDCNPWTVTRSAMWVFEGIAPWIRIRSSFCDFCSCCYPWSPCRPDCHVCWTQPNREARP